MGKKAAAPGKAPAGEGEAQRKRKQGAPVRRDNGEKPTKRAKKKKTAVEIKAEAAEKEKQRVARSRNAAKEYLLLWEMRDQGSGWRFKKLVQVWLLQHLYDKGAVDKKLFSASLPYLQGLQGSARERELARASRILKACRRAAGEDVEEEEGEEEAEEGEEGQEEGEDVTQLDEEALRVRRKRSKQVVKALLRAGGADQ